MTRTKAVLRLGVAALFMVAMVSGSAAASLTVADASQPTDGGTVTFDVTTDDHDDECETRLSDADGDGDPELIIDCNG